MSLDVWQIYEVSLGKRNRSDYVPPNTHGGSKGCCMHARMARVRGLEMERGVKWQAGTMNTYTVSRHTGYVEQKPSMGIKHDCCRHTQECFDGL